MMKKFLWKKKGKYAAKWRELSVDTYYYYQSAHHTDQRFSVRACAVRQRHIDQAQSMNLYITNQYTLRQLFDLYLSAWELGVKPFTMYGVNRWKWRSAKAALLRAAS